MKLILIGLTLTFWILWYPSYTQTDSVYCLPIGKARLLVWDALRLQLSDSLNAQLSRRILLADAQYKSSHSSFTNLLKIEQEKYKTEQEKTDEVWKTAYSFRDQMNSVQKASRKHKRERNVLGLALVVVISLAIIK